MLIMIMIIIEDRVDVDHDHDYHTIMIVIHDLAKKLAKLSIFSSELLIQHC